jgi:hypothetical protein
LECVPQIPPQPIALALATLIGPSLLLSSHVDAYPVNRGGFWGWDFMGHPL